MNKQVAKLYNRGVETLRQPDRNPRCYELTDEERLAKAKLFLFEEWHNKNDAYLKQQFGVK